MAGEEARGKMYANYMPDVKTDEAAENALAGAPIGGYISWTPTKAQKAVVLSTRSATQRGKVTHMIVLRNSSGCWVPTALESAMFHSYSALLASKTYLLHDFHPSDAEDELPPIQLPPLQRWIRRGCGPAARTIVTAACVMFLFPVLWRVAELGLADAGATTSAEALFPRVAADLREPAATLHASVGNAETCEDAVATFAVSTLNALASLQKDVEQHLVRASIATATWVTCAVAAVGVIVALAVVGSPGVEFLADFGPQVGVSAQTGHAFRRGSKYSFAERALEYEAVTVAPNEIGADLRQKRGRWSPCRVIWLVTVIMSIIAMVLSGLMAISTVYQWGSQSRSIGRAIREAGPRLVRGPEPGTTLWQWAGERAHDNCVAEWQEVLGVYSTNMTVFSVPETVLSTAAIVPQFLPKPVAQIVGLAVRLAGHGAGALPIKDLGRAAVRQLVAAVGFSSVIDPVLHAAGGLLLVRPSDSASTLVALTHAVLALKSPQQVKAASAALQSLMDDSEHRWLLPSGPDAAKGAVVGIGAVLIVIIATLMTRTCVIESAGLDKRWNVRGHSGDDSDDDDSDDDGADAKGSAAAASSGFTFGLDASDDLLGAESKKSR